MPALAAALAGNRTVVRLRSVEASESIVTYADGVERYAHPLSKNLLGEALRASPKLESALATDASAGAILHTHGLWLMPNVYPAWVKKRLRGSVTLVHSPRGMLGRAALKISAWKKRPFWWLLQRSALEAADCLHATASSEFEEIREMGLKNPVAIISNGVDLPDLASMQRPRTSDDAVLSLGRIHPKKGLDRLVCAWARVEHDFPSWKLRIVGPAELGHDKELAALARSMGLQRVSIEGPIYGAEEKLAAYRSADLFVLSTLNENFAMTVAEALAAEVPVISTKGAPWAGLERERCGWWIDHGVEPLAVALREAMTIEREERYAMGARGRAWMERDFGWDRIACDMLEVYRWLKVGGHPPATVRLD